MLIQERDCIEKQNLKWNSERGKYEIPFDIKELNNYEFIDSIYLGKEKHCSLKLSGSISPPLDLALAQEIINRNRLVKECSPEVSNDIVFLIKQTLAIGVVLSLSI